MVVLPREDPTLGGEAALLELERGEFRGRAQHRRRAAPSAFRSSPSPGARETRSPGRLVLLTDPLAFSSSEDFLPGLQGLEHVIVVGERTGGGSGGPRALRPLPGWTLTVSTTLTFDRTGRCVAGSGIPVDVEAAGTDDEVLAVALAL